VIDDGLAEALAGDLDGSFERFVRAYQDRLYGYVLRLVGHRADAEEIAQDTFVRAYRALARYPAERVQTLALRPWLFQIALNLVRNRWRARPPETEPLEGEDGELPSVEASESERPDLVAVRHETNRDLAALLLTLPERYRVAVVLRHVEGLGYGELAQVLGQPVGTVKSNVHRGTRLLRAALEQEDWRAGVRLGAVAASGRQPRPTAASRPVPTPTHPSPKRHSREVDA
jgi:RNA polymerase sigma-70 factor (ECF subfamily)